MNEKNALTVSQSAAPRHRGFVAALALLLALLALAAAAYGGWRLWQLTRIERGAHGQVSQLQQQVAQLRQTVDTLQRARAAQATQLSAADDASRDLRQQLQGLSGRTRHLEDAVAHLSAKQLSGRDGMLLDETDMLLRIGQARFELFHDAGGALAAYTLADHALAAVGDPGVSGVRQSVERERAALAALHPQARVRQLQQVAAMRRQLPTLPLKPLDAGTAPGQGVWARVWHALSHLVRIDRDDGRPALVADGRLGREWAALDLAQAQAARLAFDEDGWKAALQRADRILAMYFDAGDTRVRQIRARIGQWQQAASAPAPQLGAALRELRNLRLVHDESAAAPSQDAQ